MWARVLKIDLLSPPCSKNSIVCSSYKNTSARSRRLKFIKTLLLAIILEVGRRQGMAECLPREQTEEDGSPPPPSIPVTKPSRPSSSKSRSQKEKDEEIEESLKRLKNQGKYVKLNVGGSLHYTTLGTLTKHDNMLRAMFSERIPLQTDDEGVFQMYVCVCVCVCVCVREREREREHVCSSYSDSCVYHTIGWVLIDRSGKYFGTILNFLRDGSVSLPETKKECLELAAEAK